MCYIQNHAFRTYCYNVFIIFIYNRYASAQNAKYTSITPNEVDSFFERNWNDTTFQTVPGNLTAFDTDSFWENLFNDSSPTEDNKKVVFIIPKSEFDNHYNTSSGDGQVPIRYLVAILPNYGSKRKLTIADTRGALSSHFKSEEDRLPKEFLNRNLQEELTRADLELLKKMVSTRFPLPITEAQLNFTGQSQPPLPSSNSRQNQ